MQLEGKKGVLNLAVINAVFVSLLTASMVGSTAFCMYWYGTTYVAIFSTIIKHAPTTYIWELCSHAVMPLWYLCVFGNYLDICRRIEKFAVYHRDRRFLGMNIQSWADLMLMLSLWGAFHFALCTSIPNGRTDVVYLHLYGLDELFERKLHNSLCHTSFFASGIGQLGLILSRFISKRRKQFNTFCFSFYDSLQWFCQLAQAEERKLIMLSIATVSGISFSFTGRQLAALLEYVAIFGLVWGQLMWIPNVRVSCQVEFSV